MFLFPWKPPLRFRKPELPRRPGQRSASLRLARRSPQPSYRGVGFPVELTVTGKNFRPGASVKFGTWDGGVVSVSDTRILVTTPGESAGTVDVTVVNPDGTSATLLKGFTYTTGPIVYTLSPKQEAPRCQRKRRTAKLYRRPVITIVDQPRRSLSFLVPHL